MIASNKTPDVVVAGHICLDIIPDLEHMKLAQAGEFYTPSKLLNTGAATLSTGGPVSNTGLALVKMGVATALMGKVGQDPFGQLVAMLLKERWGITEGLIMADGATTSYTIVISPPPFDRMFLHCPGANDTFTAADIDYELVAQARLFHLGYPPLMRRMYENDGRELVEIFRHVKSLGVTTSLDMSLPDPNSPSGKVNWRGVLEKLLPHVDIYLPSAEETLFMLNRPRFDEYRSAKGDMINRFTGQDLHEMGQTLLGLGSKIVEIKLAHRGSYLRTAGADKLAAIGRAKPGQLSSWADRELWHAAYQIPGRPNATGSGDSSIAGFLTGYLRGHDAAKTLDYANGAGACNVMAPDALSGIRPWAELEAMLKTGWATQPLTVDGADWHAGNDGIWRGPADATQLQP